MKARRRGDALLFGSSATFNDGGVVRFPGVHILKKAVGSVGLIDADLIENVYPLGELSAMPSGYQFYDLQLVALLAGPDGAALMQVDSTTRLTGAPSFVNATTFYLSGDGGRTWSSSDLQTALEAALPATLDTPGAGVTEGPHPLSAVTDVSPYGSYVDSAGAWRLIITATYTSLDDGEPLRVNYWLKSTDGGATWSQICAFDYVLAESGGDVRVQSADYAVAYESAGGTLIAGYGGSTGTRVIRSTDGGATWSVEYQTTSGPGSYCKLVLYDPTLARWFVGGSNVARYSTDDGLTWSASSGTPSAAHQIYTPVKQTGSDTPALWMFSSGTGIIYTRVSTNFGPNFGGGDGSIPSNATLAGVQRNGVMVVVIVAGDSTLAPVVTNGSLASSYASGSIALPGAATSFEYLQSGSLPQGLKAPVPFGPNWPQG